MKWASRPIIFSVIRRQYMRFQDYGCVRSEDE
jgi:hypothetical protein